MLKLYVNGRFEKEISIPSSVLRSSINSISRIGKAQKNSNGSIFQGTIDDVRVYNRALNQGEITKLYNDTTNAKAGFYELSPAISYSNLEYSDINIRAYPIDSNSTIELVNQNVTIKPDSILSRNNCSLIARFYWANQPAGKYDVLLISQGDTVKLKDCFTLIHRSKAIEPTDTDNDGYRNISSFANLIWIFENNKSWTWNFELDNDIDASESKDWYEGKGFKPITSFSGIIDGQGYKIKHLYFNRPVENNVAFIGQLANNGTIRNLGLTNCNCKGGNLVASLVGKNNGGIISNCYASGTISGNENIGGIVGNNNGTIKTCYNSALVQGTNNIGGLAGNGDKNSIISESYNIGRIVGGNLNVGGVVGANSGKINNCFNNGTIIGAGEVAGISGRNYGTISNTYNRGFINGTGNNCGVINGYGNGLISNSFWDIETSGLTTSKGGTSKTSNEMKTQSTYSN